MRVAAHVVEHLLWPGEGPFRVDDPLRPPCRRQMLGEALAIGQRVKRRRELQLPRIERVLETFQEETAEETGQDADRQEEARSAGDPASPIDRETAARDDAVQMWMMDESLSPGVQHCEEADLCAEMCGVGGDGAKRLGRSAEEDAVDHRFVGSGDDRDLAGDGEHDVEVRRVEQFGLAVLDPRRAGERLAGRAMAIAAAVVPDAPVAAAVALLDVSTKGIGPALLDRRHHTPLGGRQ
jgi:hypothetical protein